MTQPAQAPQQRFVELPLTYHLDSNGPDPELKKLLPLLFTSLSDTGTNTDHEEEIFPSLFVDNTLGASVDAAATDKTMPIALGDVKGVSSYFSGKHPGLDIRADVGTSVHSILPGVVNFTSFERGGYGNFVILVHHLDGKTVFSLYAHMKGTTLQVGDTVAAGQKIGEVGMTGRTTGPHLHFEIHEQGRAINPLAFFKKSALEIASTKKTHRGS